MPVDVPASQRSYGCSYACGNPYDVVLISVADGTTEFLCFPCFVRTAHDVLDAMTKAGDVTVERRIAEAGSVDAVPMNDDGVVKRGHNAPVDSQDPDAIETFAGFELADEIDDAFQPEA